jgi:hypothetical protein
MILIPWEIGLLNDHKIWSLAHNIPLAAKGLLAIRLSKGLQPNSNLR